MSCSRLGHVIMSSQKIRNRIERVWIKPTDLETCKVIYSERKKDCDLRRKQIRITAELYKPVYDVKKIN